MNATNIALTLPRADYESSLNNTKHTLREILITKLETVLCNLSTKVNA